MHRFGRADHVAAEHLADRLMSEANTKQRNSGGDGFPIRSRQMPSLVRRADRPGKSTSIASASHVHDRVGWLRYSLRCTFARPLPNSPRSWQ